VVFLKRPGGQSQFIAHLAAQIAAEGRIQAVQHWILDHLSLDLTVKSLAVDRRGVDADRRAKLLIYQAMEGSILKAYLHLGLLGIPVHPASLIRLAGATFRSLASF
jgi:transcriptional regulator GlxA family with amidase domain